MTSFLIGFALTVAVLVIAIPLWSISGTLGSLLYEIQRQNRHYGIGYTVSGAPPEPDPEPPLRAVS